MPRIISIGQDGYLLERTAPEFESLRGSLKGFPKRGLETPFILEDVAVDTAEIEAEFTGNGAFGLELRRSDAGETGVTVTIQGGYVNVGMPARSSAIRDATNSAFTSTGAASK